MIFLGQPINMFRLATGSSKDAKCRGHARKREGKVEDPGVFIRRWLSGRAKRLKRDGVACSS